MEVYGFWGKLNTESECVAQLMKMYQKLVDNFEKRSKHLFSIDRKRGKLCFGVYLVPSSVWVSHLDF